MASRQLSFLPSAETEYRGDSSRGKRKTQRPFNRKAPLHVTLRSSRARGAWSMLRPSNKWRIHDLLQKTSGRYRIRVYRFANVGNHLHILIQARTRSDLKGFLREFAGRLAMTITGAVKGRPVRFWDALAHTKIVTWGRQFKNATRYILLNILEPSGLRDRGLLSQLETEGILILAPVPDS